MSLSDCIEYLHPQLLAAVQILRQGGVVAFPTESSYGLAVDIFNDDALQRLYQLKGRVKNKPFPVIVGSDVELYSLVECIPFAYRELMEKYWPGALTLVFPCRKSISSVLTGGKKTIAVRQSSHPVASGLVTAFQGALTATSANLSGRQPCTTAAEVVKTFGSKIDLVFDGGEAAAAPSTIVELQQGVLKVLREGQLAAALFTD